MKEKQFLCPLQDSEHASLLLDYCARRLDPDKYAALEAHIERCPSCREFRDGQRLLWDALDAWETAPPPAGFNRSLYQRIDDGWKPAWAERLGHWAEGISWKPALPVAALFALWMVFYPPAAPDPPAPSDEIQTEQVEHELEDMDMLQQLKLTS